MCLTEVPPNSFSAHQALSCCHSNAASMAQVRPSTACRARPPRPASFRSHGELSSGLAPFGAHRAGPARVGTGSSCSGPPGTIRIRRVPGDDDETPDGPGGPAPTSAPPWIRRVRERPGRPTSGRSGLGVAGPRLCLSDLY